MIIVSILPLFLPEVKQLFLFQLFFNRNIFRSFIIVTIVTMWRIILRIKYNFYQKKNIDNVNVSFIIITLKVDWKIYFLSQ